jgi:hypothetical protein
MLRSNLCSSADNDVVTAKDAGSTRDPSDAEVTNTKKSDGTTRLTLALPSADRLINRLRTEMSRALRTAWVPRRTSTIPAARRPFIMGGFSPAGLSTGLRLPH